MGKAADALNALYAAYVADPVAGLDPLLAGILHTARRMFRDEDGAQEFLVAAWQSLPGLKIKNSFAAWLHQFAIWRRIDWHRSQNRMSSREQQAPALHDDEGETLTDQDFLDVMAYRHEQAQPRPESEPDIESITDLVVLQAAELLIEGYSQGEAAERLGLRPSALRKRLERYRTLSQKP